MIRSFIALKLTGEVTQELACYADRIKSQDKRSEIRWLPTENYHLTLCFLGNIEQDAVDSLKLSLSNKVTKTRKIILTISDISFFPFTKNPRVVAGIIQPTDQLKSLKTLVDQTARNINIPVEKKSFKPHITLGRVNSRFPPKLKIPPQPLLLTCEVGEITVLQSKLTPKGAIYTPLFEIPMRI